MGCVWILHFAFHYVLKITNRGYIDPKGIGLIYVYMYTYLNVSLDTRTYKRISKILGSRIVYLLLDLLVLFGLKMSGRVGVEGICVGGILSGLGTVPIGQKKGAWRGSLSFKV